MEILILSVLDIFLLFLVILLLLFIKLPNLLPFLSYRIEIIRDFIKENEGFFSIFFIFLFATEQVILIILISKFGYNLNFLRVLISIFALVVVTTASLQKFILETKRRYDNQERVEAKEYLESRENRNVRFAKRMLEEIDKLTRRIKDLKQK
ncbi:hypothetical protein HYX17_03310 [Candidatus Woesearchaeota archaeon]|nr:hypothetical protein [Candidatus Woesearchaeota archaeon]